MIDVKCIDDEHKWTPCVYMLINDGEVIYVGQTMNLERRIYAHLSNYEFTHYECILCTHAEMNELETKMIVEMNPVHNKVLPSNMTYTNHNQAVKLIQESLADIGRHLPCDYLSVQNPNYKKEWRIEKKYLHNDDLKEIIGKIKDSAIKIIKQYAKECKK